jgi:hypothetical protein
MDERPLRPKDWTDDEQKALQSAVQRVWQYVGGDYLQAAGEGRKNPESVTISRAEVIEVSLDAGRPEEELKKMKRPELAEKLNQTDYASLIKMVRPAFPYGRYGF